LGYLFGIFQWKRGKSGITLYNLLPYPYQASTKARMSKFEPQLYCVNPSCTAPINALGQTHGAFGSAQGPTHCAACQTPLVYRYLWALNASEHPVSSQVGRYWVQAPQIWLDTQPRLAPESPPSWPEPLLPYFYLYEYRQHIPEIYGYCPTGRGKGVFLLENLPLDAQGRPFPHIVNAWADASALRQVNWLWQLLRLWQPLAEQGVASSLLDAENIRVQGGWVRLCQLYQDAEVLSALQLADPKAVPTLTLGDLGNLWFGWSATAKPEVALRIRAIAEQMQSPVADVETISQQLNQLLLEQSAQVPLHLQIAGGSDAGPTRSHNEDSCLPLTLHRSPQELLRGSASLESAAQIAMPQIAVPQIAIVCDGIGGHEGGEVASQLATRSLNLQAQALLNEIAQQDDISSPQLVGQQLEVLVRVVNNLIANQNDSQHRENRRRMGTTLVMALLLNQKLTPSPSPPSRATDAQPGSNLESETASSDREALHSQELYLVHVGDSRAYWITPSLCQRITIDDDISTREVRLGRSTYREALGRPDAGVLTQAVGTRDAEFLAPTVQRYLIDEPGLLLLCSDGLSDHDQVENHWQELCLPLFEGKTSVNALAQSWLDLANQENGHDNSSVVLIYCQPGLTGVSLPSFTGPGTSPPEPEEILENALNLEAAEPESAAEAVPHPRRRRWGWMVLLLLALGSGGWFALDSQAPQKVQQLWQRVLPNR
jgi:protein phosphatase